MHTPIGGAIEWRVAAGAHVEAGAPLAWLAGPGRCGLVALVAPCAGALRWRRDDALEVVYQGELAALIDGDDAELAACHEAERDAALRALRDVAEERATLDREGPLAVALLGPQRRAVDAREARLRRLLAS